MASLEREVVSFRSAASIDTILGLLDSTATFLPSPKYIAGLGAVDKASLDRSD